MTGVYTNFDNKSTLMYDTLQTSGVTPLDQSTESSHLAIGQICVDLLSADTGIKHTELLHHKYQMK